MGAGYGESARSALLTRGFSEILRFAIQLGAEQKTLYGLSGLGDLVLTCTSPQSRNYSYGFSIGASKEPNMEDTIEGIGTAQAVLSLSKKYNLELPIIRSVVDIIEGSQSVDDVLQRLLKRPLGEE
jgi:glycerol-3-phosphate dehydrogenase (NAD(P)+)